LHLAGTDAFRRPHGHHRHAARAGGWGGPGRPAAGRAGGRHECAAGRRKQRRKTPRHLTRPTPGCGHAPRPSRYAAYDTARRCLPREGVMKVDKETLVKHHFWILLGVLLPMVLIALCTLWFGAASDVKKKEEELQAMKKQLEGLK